MAKPKSSFGVNGLGQNAAVYLDPEDISQDADTALMQCRADCVDPLVVMLFPSSVCALAARSDELAFCTQFQLAALGDSGTYKMKPWSLEDIQ